MKYILLYQLNHDINTRSYYEDSDIKQIFDNMIKLYLSKIEFTKENNKNSEEKDKPFVDINDFFIFYYSIFDIMLLIKTDIQPSLLSVDDCIDEHEFSYETYGKDSILKMFLEYMDELTNGGFTSIVN